MNARTAQALIENPERSQAALEEVQMLLHLCLDAYGSWPDHQLKEKQRCVQDINALGRTADLLRMHIAAQTIFYENAARCVPTDEGPAPAGSAGTQPSLLGDETPPAAPRQPGYGDNAPANPGHRWDRRRTHP